MSESKGLAVVNQAEDTVLDARVIESLVMRGDISGLGPKERVAYYLRLCKSLGLNASAQPFTFLRLQGKEVLYAGRGCTDQLARIHGITRELSEQPKVIDLGGQKIVYAVCRATLPNGRSETSTATLPMSDPSMVLMKVETKAKRRATLSILGLAILDETEVADIQEASKEPGGGIDLSLASENDGHPYHGNNDETQPPPPNDDAQSDAVEPPAALVFFLARVDEIELPGEAIAVWIKHRAGLGLLSAQDRESAWRALCKKTEEVGKMKNAKFWLKKAIFEEDSRRKSAQPSGDGAYGEPLPDNDPTPSGPNGGTRRPSGATSTEASGSVQESHGGSGASVSRWEPVTTSEGVTIDDETAAREHLARLHPVALGHSFARHRHHRAWCDLVVAALATRSRCTVDEARFRLNRSLPPVATQPAPQRRAA